jgi:hypothetical protein
VCLAEDVLGTRGRWGKSVRPSGTAQSCVPAALTCRTRCAARTRRRQQQPQRLRIRRAHAAGCRLFADSTGPWHAGVCVVLLHQHMPCCCSGGCVHRKLHRHLAVPACSATSVVQPPACAVLRRNRPRTHRRGAAGAAHLWLQQRRGRAHSSQRSANTQRAQQARSTSTPPAPAPARARAPA